MVAGGRGWLRRAAALQPPERAAMIDRVVDRMAIAVGNYVAGALAQASIAGVTTFIVLEILGVPFAPALAVIIFISDLIPLVGATIGAVLVGIVTLFGNFPTATIVWVIWSIVYQQIENNLIQPQIQRRAVNVHPFIVLFSVLCGATLFGDPRGRLDPDRHPGVVGVAACRGPQRDRASRGRAAAAASAGRALEPSSTDEFGRLGRSTRTYAVERPTGDPP
jgi:hypothetical protein